MKKTRKESIFPMDSYDYSKKRKGVLRIMPMSEDSFEENFNHKKTVLVDFDRTIHKYSKGWNGGDIYDPPFEDAKEVLDWLRKKGFTIIIFTARLANISLKRSGITFEKEYNRIKEFLDKHDIPYDKITAEKYPAAFYIDDRAVHIDNGNWQTVKKVIQKRLEYQEITN